MPRYTRILGNQMQMQASAKTLTMQICVVGLDSGLPGFTGLGRVSLVLAWGGNQGGGWVGGRGVAYV